MARHEDRSDTATRATPRQRMVAWLLLAAWYGSNLALMKRRGVDIADQGLAWLLGGLRRRAV